MYWTKRILFVLKIVGLLSVAPVYASVDINDIKVGDKNNARFCDDSEYGFKTCFNTFSEITKLGACKKKSPYASIDPEGFSCKQKTVIQGALTVLSVQMGYVGLCSGGVTPVAIGAFGAGATMTLMNFAVSNMPCQDIQKTNNRKKLACFITRKVAGKKACPRWQDVNLDEFDDIVFEDFIFTSETY